MKKIFTLLSVAILSVVCVSAYAEVISQEAAKECADNLLSINSDWHGNEEASITLVDVDGVPAYYIVQYTQGGWALVSAQSTAKPYIGYNTTGTYVAPVQLQTLLDSHAKAIVKDAQTEGNVTHDAWQRVMQRKPAAEPVNTPDVAPLISVKFNQSNPYNKYCPSIDGKKALVGCVAVAMAQAMAVHGYPDRGEGTYTYVDAATGKHKINFDEEPDYDWDAIYAAPTTDDYDEVARLLYHCGVSIDMMYGTSFSGAYIVDAATALVRNFKYDGEKIKTVFRFEYDSRDEWLSVILDELLLGRAVMYQGAGGEDGTGGHCWNVDGWKKSSQMLHCNWGWGGSGDGYFDVDNLVDSYQGISFEYHHGAVIGIGTPTTAPYGIKLSTTKFVQGTAAGVALADVTVMCEDPDAVLEYEILGPKNILGKHSASPYSVQDGKLVSDKTIEDANAFKYMLMTVTNTATGESFQKEFTINVVTTGIENVLSDAMRVYPSVTTDNLVVEVPVAGGEYAVYAVSGAQVSAGNLAQYKTTIDVSQFAAGTYILRYVHNDGVGVKTFIKK